MIGKARILTRLRLPSVAIVLITMATACVDQVDLKPKPEQSGDRFLGVLSRSEHALTDKKALALKCINDLATSTDGWTKATDSHHQQYVACREQYDGVAAGTWKKKVDLDFASLPQAATASMSATASEQAVILAWMKGRGGDVKLGWSKRRGTLTSAKGRLTKHLPANADAAKKGILLELLPKLKAGCGETAASMWEVTASGKSNNDSDWFIQLRRSYNGIPVLGDLIDISFGPARTNKGFFEAKVVSTKCHRDPVKNLSVVPSVSKSTARDTAIAAFKGAIAKKTADMALAMVSRNNKLTLVWRTRVASATDHRDILVDAQTGVVLNVSGGVKHASSHAGTLTLQARLPYSTGRTTRAFSHAYIFEPEQAYVALGMSDKNGDYSNLDHITGTGHDWNTGFVGKYASTVINTDTLPSFSADGGRDYTDADLNPEVQEYRAEVYYAITYAAAFNVAAWAGSPIISPIGFTLANSPTNSNNSMCCVDILGVKSIVLGGWGSGSHPVADRPKHFRQTLIHEWAHSMPEAVTAITPECILCADWEEGRADFTGYAVNRIETMRSGLFSWSMCGPGGSTSNADCVAGGDQFYPDDKYPLNQCHCDAHDGGNIFAGVYLDLMYELGWRDAVARVNRTIESVDANTKWHDTTGNDNDFYHHMLAADFLFWNVGAWQLTIGQVWKRHDSTFDLWDYKDQFPGSLNPPYMIRPTTRPMTVDSGPDPLLPTLGVDFAADRDYLFVYTRKDATYTFTTKNLCYNTDPKMSWFRVTNGNESVAATNDNYPGLGLNARISFVSVSNEWGGIKVWGATESSASVGCYKLEVTVDDDAGDDAESARAIAPDNTWYDGEWETARDDDWYKVYVPTGGSNLVIETCERDSSNADSTLAVFFQSATEDNDGQTNENANAVVVQDADNSPCSSRGESLTYTTDTQEAGFYYIKVSDYQENDAKKYKIRASITGGSSDVGGSSRETALPVSNDELTGRYVAASISSGTDEDWFRVTLAENEHVTFHIADLQGGTDTVMQLHAATGLAHNDIKDKGTGNKRNWMREDDDGAYAALASRIHLVAPIAGDYYVRVTSYSGSSTGAYTLYIQRMGNYATAYPAYP